MEVNLELYKIFYCCATEKSFSVAASKLFVTQSAVSQQISRLEQQLGSTLFVRSRKGVSLTTAGELLLRYVSQSLELINSAEGLFERMSTLDQGEIRIGAGDTITKHFLLPKLSEYHSRYPKVKIEILNRVTHETLLQLMSGRVDIAFINLPVDEAAYPGIELRPLTSQQDIFVAGEQFGHLRDDMLNEADIASLPLIMLEPKSNSRKLINRYFSARGITLAPEFELGSHDLMYDMAMGGLGVACVTEEFSKPYLDSGELFKVNTSFRLPQRKIGLCMLGGVKLSHAAERFIEMF